MYWDLEHDWTCRTESGQNNRQDPTLNANVQNKHATAGVHHQGIISAYHQEMIPIIGCSVDCLWTAYNDDSFK